MFDLECAVHEDQPDRQPLDRVALDGEPAMLRVDGFEARHGVTRA
jgi:hypothetical protein